MEADRKLEDALDQRTSELIALRKAAVEHTAGEAAKGSPIKNLAGTLHSALGAWANNSSASRYDHPYAVKVVQPQASCPCDASVRSSLCLTSGFVAILV